MCILTDHGLADEWAGVLHRTVRAVAPGVEIVDLTHGIPRQDVRAGSLALWRCVPWLAPAIVLAVVDPGAGTHRRAVAVEVATAQGPLTFVGPDNGLLTPAAHRSGSITAAVELDDPRWHRPPAPGVGSTFAARDVFAPVAGHLAAGVTTSALGRSIDPAGLVGGPLRLARPAGGGRIEATVLWVDTFGNVQLDVASSDVAALAGAGSAGAASGGAASGGGASGGAASGGAASGGAASGGAAEPRVVVEIGSGGRPDRPGHREDPATGPDPGPRQGPGPRPGAVRRIPAMVATSYAALGARLGILPDESGLVALSLDGASAADELGLRPGDAVVLLL